MTLGLSASTFNSNMESAIQCIISRGFITRNGKREKLGYDIHKGTFVTKYGNEMKSEEYQIKRDKAIKRIIKEECSRRK